MRQPQERPSAAAASDASPTLGDPQIEGDAEEGLVGCREEQWVAERGQGRRSPQQGEGLGRRLAEIEAGIQHDPLGRYAGGPRPFRPLDQEVADLDHHVVVVRIGIGHTRARAGCASPPPRPRTRPPRAGSPGRRTR